MNGARILGQFPTSLGEDGDSNIGRGRLIPSSSWESLWSPLAQWFGLADRFACCLLVDCVFVGLEVVSGDSSNIGLSVFRFGVSERQMQAVLPNMNNFGPAQLIQQLYR